MEEAKRTNETTNKLRQSMNAKRRHETIDTEKSMEAKTIDETTEKLRKAMNAKTIDETTDSATIRSIMNWDYKTPDTTITSLSFIKTSDKIDVWSMYVQKSKHQLLTQKINFEEDLLYGHFKKSKEDKSMPIAPSVMKTFPTVDDGTHFIYSFSNLITEDACSSIIEASNKVMVPISKWAAYRNFPTDLVADAPLHPDLNIGRLQGMRDIAGIDDSSVRVVRHQSVIGSSSLVSHTTDANNVSIIVFLNDNYSNGKIISNTLEDGVLPMTVGSAIMYSHSRDIIIHPVSSTTDKYVIRLDIDRVSALKIVSRFINEYGSIATQLLSEQEDSLMTGVHDYMQNIIMA